MAEKGETKTDISSTDESDMKYKKKKPTFLLDCNDPSSSCPVYSASDDDSEKSMNMKVTKSKPRRLLNGWSPSPSKMKFKCQSDPQGVKFDKQLGTESSLMQNIENESVQPSNTELVELDKLLSYDDDIINYSNDYITIDANDDGVFIQNTTVAAVTLVTPSEPSVNQIEATVDNPNEIIRPVDTNLMPSTSSSLCNAPSTSSRQANLSNYLTKPLSISKSKAIDQQQTKFIVKHYHPFSLVEESEFCNLIKMLAPNYSMPSRKTVSNNLLLQVYNDTFQKVSKDLQDATSVALTTDGWTSINNSSFIAITKIAQEWKLENKISAVVTDNASNIKAAIRLTNWRHVPCFAHVLNIGIQNGLLQLQPVLKKIKDIVEYFKRSSSALLKLNNIQKQTGVEVLKLIQECKTRWNSAYNMMSRILKIKEPVLSTLAIMNNELNCITNQKWELIDSACKLLGIFNNVTEEMSAEQNITISKQNLYYRFLIDHLNTFIYEKNSNEIIIQMASEIKKTLYNYFKNLEDNEIQGQSIILDPRFKKFGFFNENKFQNSKTNLQQKLQSLNIENKPVAASNEHTVTEIASTSTSDIWKSFDEQVSSLVGQNNSSVASVVEMDKYMNECLLSRHMDPLKWWSERKYIYPRLYEMMKRRLCVPATSVPSERIFSKAVQVLTQRRSRMTTSKVEKIIFIVVQIDNRQALVTKDP
ncbi:E3 SUMO-protein ligase ZBED1-like [Aphis gossypii]|uniref:E3 SUMO-protein ligase ZBED1-like n=1 Tax=Aphis gossypii TaxID=80765 RepID=UPI0021593766|nr:E3 SUMO-protein ligase ZBED1-like [Aphis gossypii]